MFAINFKPKALLYLEIIFRPVELNNVKTRLTLSSPGFFGSSQPGGGGHKVPQP